MLRRGFALFVESPSGRQQRVRGFNANTGCYLVDAVPEPEEKPKAKASSCWCGRPARHRGRHLKSKPVPAKGAKATVVGRTAGG